MGEKIQISRALNKDHSTDYATLTDSKGNIALVLYSTDPSKPASPVIGSVYPKSKPDAPACAFEGKELADFLKTLGIPEDGKLEKFEWKSASNTASFMAPKAGIIANAIENNCGR